MSVLPIAKQLRKEEGRGSNYYHIRHLLFLVSSIISIGCIAVLYFQQQPIEEQSADDVVFHRMLINNDYDNLPKLSDFNAWDYVALIFMACCLALASAGGVGGGPMFVPILTIFLNFPLKRATPISNVIIVGGGISNCAFNIMKTHPKKLERPAIDFDLAIVMIPMVMAGAVGGVFLSTIFPAYTVGLLMVMVLSFSAYKAITKGRNMRRKEKAAREEAAKAAAKKEADRAGRAAVGDAPSVTVSHSALVTSNSTPVPEEEGAYGGSTHRKPSLAEKLGLDGMITRTPWKKVAYLLACFFGIVIFAVGSEAAGCGSAGYWVLYWIEVPWAAAFSIAGMVMVQNRHKYKLDNDIPFEEGDITFTKKLAMRFLLQCGFTGLMAGLFGIGGGVFIGPLLVDMKVLPQVASATTAALVLFASSVAVVKFTLVDAIIWNNYAALLFLMGLIVTYLAQYFIADHVRRTGAASIIVLSIGCSIAVGAGLMAYLAGVLIKEQGGQGLDTQFCN